MVGKFIVFEGPDRGGKSTQAALLKTYFETLGREVLLTREPGGTTMAESVRKILLEPGANVTPRAELMLYEAARAQHTEEKILPALNAGKIVVCERYTMSTLAYQGYGRGLDLDMISRLNDIASGGLKADLTCVFLMPDNLFATRATDLPADRIELEEDSFRRKMRLGYRELAAKTENTVLIDAQKSIAEISAEIQSLIKEYKII